MIQTYPKIEPELIERQGKTYVFCDAEGCEEHVAVEAETHTFSDGKTISYGPVPEGWATSDPEKNIMKGAADFCPKHADKIHVPEVEIEPISDSSE